MYTSENSKTKPEEVNQSSKNIEAQLKYQVQAKPVLKRSGENSKSSYEEVLHNEQPLLGRIEKQVEAQNSTEAEEIVLDDSSEMSTLNTTTTKRASFKSRNKSVQGVTQSKELPVANADMDGRYGH